MNNCTSCKYSVSKANIQQEGFECHFYPPQLATIHQLPQLQGGQIQIQVMSVFPHIDGSNFCGQFIEREVANEIIN